MKRTLKKRETRGQKNLQLYACPCSCSGCASVPSTDHERVYSSQQSRVFDSSYGR